MRFAMLGSGSRGNGTLIQAGATTVLMDCGFMLRETEKRLRRLGVEPYAVDAVVVTHEHSDHIGGVARVARKHPIPVWCSPGPRTAWKDGPVPRTHVFGSDEAFAIGDLLVQAFAVPHDAAEPTHFVFGDGSFRVGTLSDAGEFTDAMRAALSACDALMLEFNHDVQMLENGPYDRPLKQRVGGPLGHLSNAQSAEFLRTVDCSRLRHLVLTHLSEKNNTPALALAAAKSAMTGDRIDSVPVFEIVCAHQDEGLAWRELH
ncbi:MAG: MBL fold metallo-hydrolase [Gammaproteobacteria bacterium]